MNTRSVAIVAAASLVLVATSASPAWSQGNHVEWPAREGTSAKVDAAKTIEEIDAWQQRVLAHEPGTLDDALREIASWPSNRLAFTLDAVRRLRTRLDNLDRERRDRNRTSTPRAAEVVDWRDTRFQVGDLQRMPVFAVQDDGRPAAFFRRAATLHAEIALFAPQDASRNEGSTGDIVRVRDGRVVGFETASVHWVLGHQLISQLPPSPSNDRFVQLWYHATLASLLGKGNLSATETGLHVEAAIEELPTNPDVQFEAGRYHEGLAIVLTRIPRGATDDHRGLRGHWGDAEKCFRLALRLDPQHVEARVHLGHVLLKQDRPLEAVPELRLAYEHAVDPSLKYLSAMLLGRAEERTGRVQSALSHYQQAAELCPEAQSPHLALSRLARGLGDRVVGSRHLHDTLTREAHTLPTNPWWTYRWWQVQSPYMLLEEVWALARSEPRT
jgi:hypothetical protein